MRDSAWWTVNSDDQLSVSLEHHVLPLCFGFYRQRSISENVLFSVFIRHRACPKAPFLFLIISFWMIYILHVFFSHVSLHTNQQTLNDHPSVKCGSAVNEPCSSRHAEQAHRSNPGSPNVVRSFFTGNTSAHDN